MTLFVAAILHLFVVDDYISGWGNSVNQQQMRAALIDAAIKIVSRDGLDKATTKRLATEAGLNEVYIYRSFKDKEDLFVKTFLEINIEFAAELITHFEILEKAEIEAETRCAFFFWRIWRLMVSNRDKTSYFAHYYYSPYFTKYSSEEHRNSYAAVVERFKPFFLDNVDVFMLLNHISDVMLSTAVKVFNGELEDNEQTAEKVFNLVYRAVEPLLLRASAETESVK